MKTSRCGAMCEGKCEGEVEPPSVKAECEASAKAEASAKFECTPPSIDVQFELTADIKASATAKAEFEAWVEGFKGHMSALEAKGNIMAEASEGFVEAAGEAVTGSISELSTDANIRVVAGASCALDELPNVEGEINGAVEDMMASVNAVADISAGVGFGDKSFADSGKGWRFGASPSAFVRPAWARRCGCKSGRKETILIEANRSCGRVTNRGKEAGSENRGPMDKNPVRGDAERGERGGHAGGHGVARQMDPAPAPATRAASQALGTRADDLSRAARSGYPRTKPSTSPPTVAAGGGTPP